MQYMHIDLQISEGPKVHGPLFLGGGAAALLPRRPCYRGERRKKCGPLFIFNNLPSPPGKKKACSALASAGPPVLVLRGF